MRSRLVDRIAARAAAIMAAFFTSDSAIAQDDSSQSPAELRERVESLEKEVEDLKRHVNEVEPGSTRALLTGRASVNFTAPEHGDSTFALRFNPVLLWKLSDDLLAGAGLDLQVRDDDTDAELQWAHLTLVLNDNVMVRGGLFLTPLSYFQEQLYPSAVNRLPDKPLYLSGGGQLVPESSLGFELRGASLLGAGRLTYSVYVSNGPSIEVSGENAGRLDFRNFTDVNDNKAVGAQIGLVLLPEWEITYGLQFANVAPDGAGLNDIDLFTHALAINYQIESEAISGRLEARAEFVLGDFEGDIDLGDGPFDNDRTGGYVQIAYRPTMMEGFIGDLEGVLRWDFLNQPSDAPRPEDEQRFTIGLDYWIAPTTVFKIAYQIDDVDDPSGRRDSSNALLMQLGMGF
jgi:hypothetical protein